MIPGEFIWWQLCWRVMRMIAAVITSPSYLFSLRILKGHESVCVQARFPKPSLNELSIPRNIEHLDRMK